MGVEYSERLAARVKPGQRAEIEESAEAEGITSSELIRDGALLRARSAADGMLVAVGADAARRIRAAAATEGIDPEAWARRALDELAGRRLAGTGIGTAVGRLEAEEEAAP